ncbi:hypothetical protein AY586_01990 [Marichromatium gracile]|uniref:Uncharacterized protein n=1 Tax=Marichromatium gracile TaxID=1048 RepID=A0ABR5VHU1_MARGR|nr:hypothetical protein AY586_01990 [Marichromatium gracile]
MSSIAQPPLPQPPLLQATLQRARRAGTPFLRAALRETALESTTLALAPLDLTTLTQPGPATQQRTPQRRSLPLVLVRVASPEAGLDG